MKTIKQIATECGIAYYVVYNTIRNEGIVTELGYSKKMLTQYQEDYIHEILYFSGYLKELTFESKINENAK